MTKFEFENYDWKKGMKDLKTTLMLQKMKKPKSQDKKVGGNADDDTK